MLAAFYGGSISRNDSDIYSDIDFRIVLNENIDKEFALKEFINLFQNKLFIEHQNNDFAVFHFNRFNEDRCIYILPKRYWFEYLVK
ncbi:hypothetical protein [Staphylococcus shinii]|uniref:hypothetical protein n=1 Tax=Staphylococcus shinii TaxID=2912228 RepID=UPI003F87BD02